MLVCTIEDNFRYPLYGFIVISLSVVGRPPEDKKYDELSYRRLAEHLISSHLRSTHKKVKKARSFIWNSIVLAGFVLEYYCWYTANTLTTSVFDALSFGNSLVAAVTLLTKRGSSFSRLSPVQLVHHKVHAI